MIPNKIRKCSCIYIYRKCASSAKLSVLQKKSANVPAKQWKKCDVYMYTRTIKLTHFISGCIVNFPKQ